jgi:hypothetical protein
MQFFMPFLGLLFIGLKLTDVIDWSWWLVLLPIYGPVVLVLIFVSGLAALIFKTK